MQGNPKQKIEKTLTILFFVLLALDASKIFFAPPLPTQQQQQEQPQNQHQYDGEKQQQQNQFEKNNEDEADSFKEFKENEFDEEKYNKKQNKRNPNRKKGTGTYSDPNILTIQYCAGSKYKAEAAFTELRQAIQREFEFMDVDGQDYPVSEGKLLLSKVCGYLQWVVIGFSFLGDKIFGMLQMPYPAWYTMFKEKKMIFIMVGFTASNFLSQYIIQTGAFEMYLDNSLIYSNIGKNGAPDQGQIMDIISGGL